MNPVVKICGLRRRADAELALELGADYLGCVLAADSPRCASVAEVQAIAAAAQGRGDVVLVFRRTSEDRILELADATGVRRVQVHGTSPVACRHLAFYGLAVHPVFRVDAGAAALPVLDPLPREDCPAVLDYGAGGSGRRFDWSLLAAGAPPATLVAGGVTPDNVAELLHHRPFGLDVSSGVEAAPGVKDADTMRQLFVAVHGAAAGRAEVGGEVRS